MMRCRITRVVTVGTVALCAFAYACQLAEEETSSSEQAGSNTQGSNTQGTELQGSNTQGTELADMSLVGFLYAGATKNGVGLTNLRVEKGELVAELDGATIRGTDFASSQFPVQLEAQARKLNPTVTATVQFRITAVEEEDDDDPDYDPTNTGNTFLYTIEQWDNSLATPAWVPACPEDEDGRRAAIPLTAEWDEQGNRSDSGSMFTLGCTTGVIAKCYRWGYRPWVTGYGDLTLMHQTCTRAARADYCGNGTSHTEDGTLINIWDKLPNPGPIQSHGGLETIVLPPLEIFEGAWDANGAVCLTLSRWDKVRSVLEEECEGNRLFTYVLGVAIPVACVLSPITTRLLFPSAVIFTESYNLDLL